MTNSMSTFRPNELFLKSDKEKSRRPHIDVGEFLSPELNGYNEIARMSLSSTTGDVIVIRAKKTKNGFKIRVEDEYDTEYSGYKTIYKLIPTQGEVFDVIKNLSEDDLNCLMQYIEYNDFKTIEEITDFIYIDSKIYPNLNELFIDYLKQLEL
jgi:hypothetical protein